MARERELTLGGEPRSARAPPAAMPTCVETQRCVRHEQACGVREAAATTVHSHSLGGRARTTVRAHDRCAASSSFVHGRGRRPGPAMPARPRTATAGAARRRAAVKRVARAHQSPTCAVAAGGGRGPAACPARWWRVIAAAFLNLLGFTMTARSPPTSRSTSGCRPAAARASACSRAPTPSACSRGWRSGPPVRQAGHAQADPGPEPGRRRPRAGGAVRGPRAERAALERFCPCGR